ncbi:hypothetical protein M153_423000323 [Pseudoloma neurophilia]|uniref:Secreted protein n=1 Tax=Pseudoloma neurophilia TaxID=146866 RepID=A0A0R0M535_9MICR|nr:hypothetical protein M153_423000323 [Pseudoloma neurophilia]
MVRMFIILLGVLFQIVLCANTEHGVSQQPTSDRVTNVFDYLRKLNEIQQKLDQLKYEKPKFFKGNEKKLWKDQRKQLKIIRKELNQKIDNWNSIILRSSIVASGSNPDTKS